MRIEHSITIDRPADQVFAYLTDPDKLASWQPTTVEVRRSREGPFAVGERFQEVHAALGKKLESTLEVVEYQPPSLFALHILEGAMPVDGRWELESKDGSTLVHFTGEGGLKGPLRLAGPLASRSLNRRFRGYHKLLKEQLESQPR